MSSAYIVIASTSATPTTSVVRIWITASGLRPIASIAHPTA